MATLRKTITECDRCSFGTVKEATTERKFYLDELWWKLDLCEEHAKLFDREWGGWTRLAQEIDGPQPDRVHSNYFTAERKRETERLRELRDKAQREAASREFAARRAAEIEEETRIAAEAHARNSIPGAAKWSLTTHARARMVQREFTIEDVLRTAAEPHFTEARPERGKDIWLRQRGQCRVIVDATSHTIITVVDRADRSDTPPIPEHLLEKVKAI